MRFSARGVAAVVAAVAISALSACAKSGSAGKSPEPGSPRLVAADAGEGSELTLDFGATLLDSEVRRSVSVANAGPAGVTITDALLAEGSSKAFRCTTPLPLEVKAGQRATIELSFRPTSDGEASATLRLLVARGDVEVLLVHMRGTGVRGTCAPSTERLDFGETSVGKSYLQTLAIRNSSTLPLTVTIPELDAASGFVFGPGFSAGTHVVPAAAESAGTLEIPIAFAPAHAGEFTARLSLPSTMPCTAEIALHGTGVARAVDCEPTVHDGLIESCRVDFGFVHLGNTVLKSVRFRNLGVRDVTLTATSLTQPMESAPFGVEASQAALVIPAGGAPVSVELSFLPTALGEQHGRLEFDTDVVDMPAAHVDLVGTGGGPAIDVRPSALDFSTDIVGFGLVQQIVIANVGEDVPAATADNLLLATAVGDGSWTEKRAEIAGPDAADFSVEWPPRNYTAAAGLAAGDTAFLVVRFTPAALGEKTATLSIYSSDPRAPVVDVPITGRVVELPPCNYEIEPGDLEFGSVQPGSSLTRHFAIINRDPEPTHECLAASIDVTPSTTRSGNFAVVDGPRPSAIIRGGESLDVPVRFQPQQDGSLTGEVEFFVANSPRARATVTLSGVAERACLSIEPREFDYGSIGLNCNSRQHLFAMTNACADALSVSSIELLPGNSSSDFLITKRPALPVTIAAVGSSVEFGVVLHASTTRDYFGVVAVRAAGSTPHQFLVSLSGQGTASALQTDTFTSAPLPKVDVLFVIDNSSSMVGLQDSLATNFAAFAQYLDQVEPNLDFHIAVTTTDLSASGAAGELLPLAGTAARFISRSTPNLDQAFSSLANVGTAGSETESLIRPAYLALSEPLLSGPNAGFYRDDAKLAVAIVSDAADHDPVAASTLDYVTFFVDLKGAMRRNDVTVSAVVPTQATAPSGCSYDSPDAGEDVRVKSVVDDMAGSHEEICAPGWGPFLARDLLNPCPVWNCWPGYPLSNTPDMSLADPIVVQIDGQPFNQYGPRGEQRWDYNPATNSIVFAHQARPDPGATISVTYHVACW